MEVLLAYRQESLIIQSHVGTLCIVFLERGVSQNSIDESQVGRHTFQYLHEQQQQQYQQ